jgi:DNA-binding transcriptional LysR family regulator
MLIMDSMNGAHLSGIDLNLLPALDALLEERNVTRAAARVGVTQSAMSHALARLRVLTGDELLVRAGGAMVTTPRAEALAGPVRRALEEVGRALAPPAAFDARTAKLSVRLGMSDYVEIVLLPRLVALLGREAPRIDLAVHGVGDPAAADLAAGTLDLAIFPPRPEEHAPGVLSRRLFDERFVCVVRKGHPLAGEELTLARYAAADHALISPRGKKGGFLDEALARFGLSRRVAVMVPHFVIAPHLVAASDLVLTLAARVAEILARPLGLAVLPLPPELRLEGFTLSSLWHARTQDDPAQRWIRDQVAEVGKTV